MRPLNGVEVLRVMIGICVVAVVVILAAIRMSGICSQREEKCRSCCYSQSVSNHSPCYGCKGYDRFEEDE